MKQLQKSHSMQGDGYYNNFFYIRQYRAYPHILLLEKCTRANPGDEVIG